MAARRTVYRALAIFLTLAGMAGHAAEHREIRLTDGTEVPVAVHAAKGRELLLWLPSGFPLGEHEQRLAEEIAELGVEVWRVNLLEGRFLPLLESSLEEIPDRDVAELIAYAHRVTGKRVLLAGLARGGLLALRGAQAYLAGAPTGKALAGAVLLHPNLYIGPPEPGQEALYHPAVAAARAPVFLIQPENSPWRWRLDTTQAELRKGDARIFVHVVKEARDRFYFRSDATEVEERLARELAGQIRAAVKLLASQPLAPPAPVAIAARPASPAPGIRARELRPYRGNPVPPPLRLADLHGRVRGLADSRGRVVLVNFWASWCPPCVHEMPSMQRLKEKLAGKPFEILAVNMAEDEATIRQFLAGMAQVDARMKSRAAGQGCPDCGLDFPILLDRDGAALKDWKVFVFPTSFLLGPDGKIAYALFGELTWDTDEVVRIVEGLLPAPGG
jgi:thiol-disulfide isomerase/thioredoxin